MKYLWHTFALWECGLYRRHGRIILSEVYYFMIVGCTTRSDDQDENPKCVIQPSNVNTLICESAAKIAVVYLLIAG